MANQKLERKEMHMAASARKQGLTATATGLDLAAGKVDLRSSPGLLHAGL
jgi:hypothetical protein